MGDYDNDGDLDAVVNCVNAVPQLLRCDSTLNGAGSRFGWWVRSQIGPELGRGSRSWRRPGQRHVGRQRRCQPLTQIEEVRSCNGYYSASDLRIHFGLGEATKADLVEIRWPSGTVDTLKDLDVNRLYVIEEGGKILKTMAMGKK